jgi:hypothetical protein
MTYLVTRWPALSVRPPTASANTYLLLGLGFRREPAESHWQVYRHDVSNTVFVFSAQPPDMPARDIDIVSVRRHLGEKGLVDDRAFGQLLKSATEMAE